MADPLTRQEVLSVHLDALGIVLVNVIDPVDNSIIAGLDWRQVEKLVDHYEEALAVAEGRHD